MAQFKTQKFTFFCSENRNFFEKALTFDRHIVCESNVYVVWLGLQVVLTGVSVNPCS